MKQHVSLIVHHLDNKDVKWMEEDKPDEPDDERNWNKRESVGSQTNG